MTHRYIRQASRLLLPISLEIQALKLLNTSNVKAESGSDLSANLILIEKNPPKAEIDMADPTYNTSNQKWFDGTDKEISLKVSDSDSGIRCIKVLVNGKPVTNAIESSYMLDSVTETIPDAVSALKSNDLILSENKSIHLESKISEANYKFSIDKLIETAGDSDGEYTLQVYAIDNAGNVSVEEQSKVIFYRDITSPNVTDFRFSNPSQTENKKDKTDPDEMNGITIDQNQNIVKTDYGYYFKESFDLTVYAEDDNASSGFASVTLTLVDYTDGNAVRRESETKYCTYDSEGNVVFPTFTIESGFKGMILAKVTDNTGNVSGERSPRAFVSDNSKSEISIKVNNEPIPSVSGANGDKLYTDNVSFTVTITDTKSGLKEIVYDGVSDGTPGYNSDIKTIIDDENNKEIGTDIGNGWIVESTDLNVVTSVKKTFTFGEAGDDTGIFAKLTAKDNANNSNEEQTFSFTIYRVNPEINKVSLNSSDGTKEVQFTENNAFEYKYFYKTPFSVTTQASDPSP